MAKKRYYWIKLYTRLLTDKSFTRLTLADRGLLITIWMIAAEYNKDGLLPSPSVLSKYSVLGFKYSGHPSRITKMLHSMTEQSWLSYDLMTEQFTIRNWDRWQYASKNDADIKLPNLESEFHLDISVDRSTEKYDEIIRDAGTRVLEKDYNTTEISKDISSVLSDHEKNSCESPSHIQRSTGDHNTSASQVMQSRDKQLIFNQETNETHTKQIVCDSTGNVLDIDDDIRSLYNQCSTPTAKAGGNAIIHSSNNRPLDHDNAVGSISGCANSTPPANIRPKNENRLPGMESEAPDKPGKSRRSGVKKENTTVGMGGEIPIESRGVSRKKIISATKDARYVKLRDGMEKVFKEKKGYGMSVWANVSDWVMFAKMLKKTRGEVFFSVDRLLYSFEKFLEKMEDFPMRVWCSQPERWFETRQNITKEGMRKAIEERKREESRLETLKACAVYAPECLTEEEMDELRRIGFNVEKERSKYINSVH